MMLSLEGVVTGYGPIRVLREVTLEMPEGSVVALIGPNGAGKTTTLKTISGLLRPWSGSITFDGQRIDSLPPDRIVAMGLAHVPEGRGVLPDLSVLENLRLGGYRDRRRKDRVAEGIDRACALFPILRQRAGQLAGNLSGGEQQMLAIARALVAAPRLLMIDEMSLGLAPQIVRALFNTVRDLRAQGVTVLLVEQYMHLAFEVADRVTMLEKGAVAASGSAQEISRARAAVHSAYLGATAHGEERDG